MVVAFVFRLLLMIKGSLKFKFPTIWRDDEKTRVEERTKEKKSEQRRYRSANVRKVAKHCVFPMIVGRFDK